MPSIKEVAAQLSVSPQTVRRYARELYNLKSEGRKPIILSDEQASAIAHAIAANNTTVATSVADVATSNTTVAHLLELKELEIQVVRLTEKCSGLERENELLREQLDNVNQALERAQESHRLGFWSRLGNKLLPSGKDGKE